MRVEAGPRDEVQRRQAPERLAYGIEDLPGDLAAMLEAGLDELWSSETIAENGDNVIS